MSVRPIVKIPSQVLYRKAHKIKVFDDATARLAQDMTDTLFSTTGVGLAAPQIGVGDRLIVIHYGEEDEDPVLYVVVNPEITERSEEMVSGVEGCLSVPGMIGEVDRHEKVTVKGFDVKGKALKIKAEGWLARIFQHETDHLDGILFTEQANRIWRPGENESYSDDV